MSCRGTWTRRKQDHLLGEDREEASGQSPGAHSHAEIKMRKGNGKGVQGRASELEQGPGEMWSWG